MRSRRRWLYGHFGFTYSTARKLIKVGSSQRIKDHGPELRQLGIDAWSTLHALTKLDDPTFERFSAEYLSPDAPKPFARSHVEPFKSGTRAKLDRVTVLAVIEVSTKDIDFDQMSGPNRKAKWLKRTGYSWSEELFDPYLNPNTILKDEFGEDPVSPEIVDSYFQKWQQEPEPVTRVLGARNYR